MIQVMAFITAGCLLAIGVWALSFKDNLIKKVLGLTFITDAVNLTLIAMGYRSDGVVPIIPENMGLVEFAANAAYPLPMALVLTNIVIGVATCALIAGLIVKAYNRLGTVSSKEVFK